MTNDLFQIYRPPKKTKWVFVHLCIKVKKNALKVALPSHDLKVSIKNPGCGAHSWAGGGGVVHFTTFPISILKVKRRRNSDRQSAFQTGQTANVKMVGNQNKHLPRHCH